MKRIFCLLCALLFLLPAAVSAEKEDMLFHFDGPDGEPALWMTSGFYMYVPLSWRRTVPYAPEEAGTVLRAELRRVAAYAGLGRLSFVSPNNLRKIHDGETGLMTLLDYALVFATDGTDQAAIIPSEGNRPQRDAGTLLGQEYAWTGAGVALAARLGLKLEPFQTAPSRDYRYTFDSGEQLFQMLIYAVLGGEPAWLGDPDAPRGEDMTAFLHWFLAWASMTRWMLGSEEGPADPELPAAVIRFDPETEIPSLTVASAEGTTTLRFLKNVDLKAIYGFLIGLFRLNGLSSVDVPVWVDMGDGTIAVLTQTSEASEDNVIREWLDFALLSERAALGQ